MLTKTMLQPTSGKGFWCRLLLEKNNLKLLIQSLHWSKDITGPTGDGTVTVAFRGDHRKILAQGDIISIKGGWVDDIRKTPTETFELVYGFVKKIKNSRTTIEIQFTDFGILLESESFIQNEFSKPLKTVLEQLIKSAGLTPVINLGSNPNEMVTVPATSTETDNTGSGGGGCVSGAAYPTSTCGGGENAKWKLHNFSWVNKCPVCGGKGTLKKVREGTTNYPGTDCDGVTCTCEADFCPTTGYTTESIYGPNAPGPAGCGYHLTPCGGGSSSEDGGVAGSYAQRVSDVNQGVSSNSWWDCIMEAINSSGADLEVYVKGTKCYVVQPAPSSQASLLVKDDINLLNEGVVETEADPTCFNEITVNYGQSIHPKKVVARNDDMIEEYGLKRGQPIDKYGLNQRQAQAYANRQLQLLERDNGYELECTVIGTKDWFVGLWTKVQIEDIDIIKTLFITKFDFKIDNTPPQIDLTLNNYIPTISSGGSSSGGGASASTLDGIFKTAQSKFRYSHSCSDAACMERVGSGDCWAMSDYLYNKISAAGINVRIIQYATSLASNHRIVQVQNSNGVWVTPSQYSVFGHAGDQYLWTSETSRENANNIIKSFTGGSNVNVTADSGD